jgi:hypothetical protein
VISGLSGTLGKKHYARVASRESPIYAKLAQKKSKKKVKNAYNIALGDWFNAPEIDCIEWKDGHICMSASDDVMVTKVTVTILGEQGQRLEQAEAQLILGVWWEYQAVNNGLIRVEAWDFAINVTRQGFVHPASIPFGKTPEGVRKAEIRAVHGIA